MTIHHALSCLRAAALAALLHAGAPALAQSSADTEIRAAFAQWTDDFNAGRKERVCDLFARELQVDFRGAPPRGYEAQC